MIKKILLLLLIVNCLLFAVAPMAKAATPTSVPTPSVTENDDKKLDKLKEDIVSTVAKKKVS